MTRPLLVVGTPGDRRLAELGAALRGGGWPPATLVPYRDVLAGAISWEALAPPGALVRIESPGKCEETRRALVAAGGGNPTLERGEVGEGTAWYRGLCHALDVVAAGVARIAGTSWMNAPAAIALMFDKARCHAHLLAAGVPVASSFGPVGSYDELVARMRELGRWRVFVKARYGSSGSGVMAYRVQGERHQAITSVEAVEQGGRLRLYNTRRLRTLTSPAAIARLVDALAGDGVHVETWVPKAGWQGRTFDVRVVVVAGRARHTVGRLSHTPLTNLHLLNRRGDAAALRAHLGETRWAELHGECERAGRAFPDALYLGLDVALPPGSGPVVIEANAFGDLLPGVLDAGEDTFTAELRAMEVGSASKF